MRTFVIVLALLAMGACSRKPAAEFSKLTNEATWKILSFSPVNASAQGLHQFEKANFDTDLDDLRYNSIRTRRDYLVDLHKRMTEFDKDALSPEDRADYEVIATQIGLALFDTDIAQTWQHSPQTYVELVGTALFNPMVLEYAPKEERFRHIIARMEKLPGFLDTARRQLADSPKIWIEVAKEENQGNISATARALGVHRRTLPRTLQKRPVRR